MPFRHADESPARQGGSGQRRCKRNSNVCVMKYAVPCKNFPGSSWHFCLWFYYIVGNGFCQSKNAEQVPKKVNKTHGNRFPCAGKTCLRCKNALAFLEKKVRDFVRFRAESAICRARMTEKLHPFPPELARPIPAFFTKNFCKRLRFVLPQRRRPEPGNAGNFPFPGSNPPAYARGSTKINA